MFDAIRDAFDGAPYGEGAMVVALLWGVIWGWVFARVSNRDARG